jgi:hypothetical protein
MKRPTHIISSAVDVDGLHPDIKALFKGLALYNDGMITVAYRTPVILRDVQLDGQSLFMHPIAIPAEQRVEIRLQGVWELEIS